MSDGGDLSLSYRRGINSNFGNLPRRALTHLCIATLYLLGMAWTAGLGAIPLVVASGVSLGGLLGKRRRHIFEMSLPFLIFAAFYHWLGWMRSMVNARGVHVYFPYWLDKAVFGFGEAASRMSYNELFAMNHLPVVDFIAGVAYLSFLPAVFGFAVYLAVLDRHRTMGVRRARRFGWTFLGTNLAGFGTYLLCPVAPPWYVAAKGFGPVDPATKASAAALVRWDSMTGIPYFQQFYAQATEVFGALPSMHCAYPMLLCLFAWEMGRKQLLMVLAGYHLLMCFSAVYLQHHYVTDVIAGMIYAGVVYLVARWAWPTPPAGDPGYSRRGDAIPG